MEEDNLQESDFINVRKRFEVPKRLEPSIDPIISSIVGKKIYSTDPRVLKLIVRFKSKKNDDEMDNFLSNPKFIAALKQELNQSL